MIVDILYIPFKGDILESYSGTVPIFISDFYSTSDDFYSFGFNTDKPIPDLFHRYKIIEITDGVFYEHIVLTNKMIDMNRLLKSSDIRLYVLTTRTHRKMAKNNIFHNQYDIAKAVLEIMNLDVPLRPIATQESGRTAPRPRFSYLRNAMLELTIGDRMPIWLDGLKRYLSKRN